MQRSTPAGCIVSNAREDVRERADPALLVDLRRAELVDANAAGLAQWQWTGEAPALPQPLDAAMPALVRLRAGEVDTEDLLLWAPSGVLRVRLARMDTVHGLAILTMGSRSAATCETGDRAARAKPSRGAKLAHELRTPLGAIAAYAEVMAQEHFGPIGDPRYRDYARIIHDSARHALGVVEGMLSASSLAQKPTQRELRFKDLDPAAIAESCLSVIAPAAEQAQISLDLACPAGLPRIVADEVSVRQMLLNLLTNAVKFARPGDRVRLAVTQGPDGSLTFAVEDTGPGIDAVRDSPDGAAARGLGVGLPLTKELAEANGAALDIESAPGCGTRARISFSPTRVVPAW
jgi:signal transduction histidine kinase